MTQKVTLIKRPFVEFESLQLFFVFADDMSVTHTRGDGKQEGQGGKKRFVFS